MVRQLRLAHVGCAGVRDWRPVAQQLVGGLARLRRGVAQQPPRLRILGQVWGGGSGSSGSGSGGSGGSGSGGSGGSGGSSEQ